MQCESGMRPKMTRRHRNSQVAPHFYTGPETDPDELLGWAQAYAAPDIALGSMPWGSW